jgi:hypothetical protein
MEVHKREPIAAIKKSPLLARRGFRLVHQRSVGQNNIRCLRTLGAFLYGEFDFLAFLEVLEAIALDGGVVDEDIRAALAGDEAIAFATIEPFDCADSAI